MTGIQDTTTNHFGSLIGNGRKYIIPKFQRDYSWEAEHWDDLWKDIENMLAEDGDHYMGYLVLQTADNKNFYIIDGQQRFTTITLIILAAIKSIQQFIDNGTDVAENEQRIRTLKDTYIGNIDPVSLEYDNILMLNRNNDGYYKEYIVKLDDLPIRNTSYTEKQMKKCFEWFENQLKNKFSTGKEYAKFISDVVDRLYFTIIKVSDELNAFRVFETLNARGVQLSSSDLLKNYLFSLVDNKSSHSGRIETLEDKWTALTKNVKAEKLPDFIRYYWNSKNKTVRSNELFKSVREHIKTDSQVFEFINEVLRYSDIYMALKSPHDEFWNNDKILQENVRLLNIFNLKQPYSLLMSAHHNLPADKFKSLFKDVIILGFRYSVIAGKNPNDVERTYNELAVEISKTKQYNRNLLKKIYVDDAEFETTFSHKSFIDNSRNNKIIKYILDKYERYKGGLRDTDPSSETDTIEHILPQNPNEDWPEYELSSHEIAYRLGNLCLLEKKYNKEIENQDYNKKKIVYTKSSFVTTKSIPEEYPSWNIDSISSRQRKMSKAAKDIWKISF